MKTLIQLIAQNCQWHKTVNENFIDECEDRLKKCQDSLPSGSGFDSGCKIDIENSGEKKIIINFSFHHMSEDGYYTEWTEHKLTLIPTFNGYDMKISGKDINMSKDYFYDTFSYILDSEVNID